VTVLADALFREGYNVVQIQSYGAEVRGTPVIAYLIYSDEPIESPFIDKFDTIIVLHSKSIVYINNLSENGLLIVNSDLVDVKRNALKVPLQSKAEEVRLRELVNMVMLGYLAKIGIVRLESLIEAVRDIGKGAEANEKAIIAGYNISV
ncbi:MAG: 2-oxoacid:acceptor oxidoreductase family protein, partial [Candidatus Methanomethylicia archaeon]